jgi:hypothetical protein
MKTTRYCGSNSNKQDFAGTRPASKTTSLAATGRARVNDSREPCRGRLLSSAKAKQPKFHAQGLPKTHQHPHDGPLIRQSRGGRKVLRRICGVLGGWLRRRARCPRATTAKKQPSECSARRDPKTSEPGPRGSLRHGGTWGLECNLFAGVEPRNKPQIRGDARPRVASLLEKA